MSNLTSLLEGGERQLRFMNKVEEERNSSALLLYQELCNHLLILCSHSI